MKKILLIVLAAGLLAPAPADARRKKKKTETAAATAKPKETTQKGLFTVTKSGENWFFEIPDSLVGRKFLTTTRFTATPANCGKFAGEQVNQQTVYWQVAPTGDKLLLRADLLVNTADSTDAINRAIVISNENPVIGAFKVESHKDGMYKVNVAKFFSEDNAAIGLPASYKRMWGLSAMLGDQSFIESIKTFPMNTEIRTVKTFSSLPTSWLIATRATGRATIGLNISFVLLPETPMLARYFDPRVGYFSDDYTYFSDEQQQVEPRRFITRWRLEPKDSADMEKMKRGELVEPKKPIVYYIDPATPKQWRKYLIQGVNDWQVAFEQAGFKNAIYALEWPENDSTMSMEDARYSVIRYLASPIENAYGPNVHDPRSGEIIESHICWYHNVMKLVHDWYMIQAGSIDEAAQKMKYDEELMGNLIRFVSSHEVGHTLGLRHNFGSSSTVPVDSLRSKAWVEANGHTPSIMDYARFNYVAQPGDGISRKGIFPRIGDYDKWAIKWGYTPMFDAYDSESDHYELEKLVKANLNGNRRLWFGDGETNRYRDPRCQTEDLGDDAVKASGYGLLNLKRMMKQLPEWTFEPNDIHGRNLSEMYSQIRTQYLRYMNHVANYVGGTYIDYKTVSESGPVYTPNPREKQLAALDFIDEQVFTEPTWLREGDFILRLTNSPQNLTESLGNSVLSRMMSSYFISGLNDEFPVAEYLTEMTDRLCKEMWSGQKPTSYRRVMQGIYVRNLIGLYQGRGLGSYEKAPALGELNRLQKRLRTVSASAADAETRAHYAVLLDEITRTLEP